MDAATCSCGCGYPKAIAHDPATKGRVVVETETCQVRSAVEAYRKKMALDSDQIVKTRLLAEGESLEDLDRSTYEALQARLPHLRLATPAQPES